MPEYRRARSVPERALAMALAALRPGPLRRRFDGLDAVHYPLTIALPPLDIPSVGDRARPAAPRPSRALLARRAALPRPHARGVGAQGERRDRPEPVRPPARDRAARPPAGARARDPVGRRPRALPARAGGAGAVPALSGAAVAAQEPRAALRGVRAPPRRAARAAARAHRRRPRGPAGAGRRRGARARLRATSSRRSTAAPPASSSRASTRASASRRSRRWRRGTPVAASNIPAIAEACGDAAALFDPTDPEDIAAVVAAVLESPERFAPQAPSAPAASPGPRRPAGTRTSTAG